MGQSLTTACILQAFSEEITANGGTVGDAFNDGDRLFVRSTLPQIAEAKANDRLQGGVALKAYGGDVWIHPYVFRLVCRNGAIMAHALSSRQVSVQFDFQPDESIVELRQAVRACCAPDVFTNSMREIRSAREVEADLAINMLPFLTRLPRGTGEKLMSQILRRFFSDTDRSRFGLMNAVTSVARDTSDPEIRWNLEELGGGIPVAASNRTPKSPARRAARRREAELVS